MFKHRKVRALTAFCAAIFAAAIAFAWAEPESGRSGGLPSGSIQSKVQTACTECHDAGIILQQRLSKKAWTKEVDKMIKWGAVVDFFFRAEDGIRVPLVTGVQTCALPISERTDFAVADDAGVGVNIFDSTVVEVTTDAGIVGYGEVCPLGPFYLPAYGNGVRAGVKELEIGRASCRAREEGKTVARR